MQALILAGGEGTRLRPLTSAVPKPVVPLVDRPFIVFMIDWLRRHGVDDVVMSCGHMAEGVRAVLGDGSAVGVRLRYMEEPEPLGTGGALKYAQELLDERFLMLNGDTLTDLDLTAQLATHERVGRAGHPRAVRRSRTPRPTGWCGWGTTAPCASSSRSPRPTRSTRTTSPRARTCSSGRCWTCSSYGERASIERDVFPRLVGNGLYGHVSGGYWMDIGTPERYLEATFDILEGNVATEVVRAARRDVPVRGGRRHAGRSHHPAGADRGRLRDRRGRAGRRSRGARAQRQRRRGHDHRERRRDGGRADRRELRAAQLHRRGGRDDRRSLHHQWAQRRR